MNKIINISLFLLIVLAACNNAEEQKKVISIDEFVDNTLENKLCLINYRYPVFRFNGEKINPLNDSISHYFDKQINSFLSLAKKDSSLLLQEKKKYRMDMEATQFVTNFGTVSVLITAYKYTLGAHGNYTYKAYNYDMAYNKFMKLSDVVSTADNKKFTELNQMLNRNFNKKDCFTKAPVIDKNFELFLIKQDSVIFLFPPYELGPYACGLASVGVAIDELP